MPVTDPIADMLTRIRNAVAARHETMLVPTSRVKLAIARILKEEGFIKDIQVLRGQPQDMIRIQLLYREREAAVSGLKRVSKPGLRVYVGKREVPRFYGGLGISVVSTSQGVMTGQHAWRRGLGGELLCYVW
ncbi:MAG: 30S ribosomal protein S8 [Chloroflexi bacterium]|nr:30S ribosomal protein S8 [Chloroflexota bacterium]